MNLPAVLLISATSLAAFASGLFAQSVNQRRAFTIADGLAENACYSVTLGAGGNVLVRHPNTNVVSVLNGYEITHVPGPGANRSRVYESPGGQLWAVEAEGLLEFRDGNWVLHRVGEIAAYFRPGFTNAPVLYPVRQGRVLILLPDRLLQFDLESLDRARVETLLRAEQPDVGNFSSLTPAVDGGLWISGVRGFVRVEGPIRNLKPDVTWTVMDTLPPELAKQQPGLIPPAELSVREVFDLAIEPSGAFWLATAGGLFRHATAIWQAMERPSLNEPELNPAPASRFDSRPGFPRTLPEEIAKHTEWKTFLAAKLGDLWLGGANDVAWRHRDAWRIFSSTNQLGPENVIAFAEAPDGRVWCATPDKIWEFDGQNWFGLRGGFEQINALHCSHNGTLWIATANGLHRYLRGAWIANGIEDGLPSAIVRRLAEDDGGGLLAETASGWCQFRPDADNDPPRTMVQPDLGEEAYREGAMVTLAFNGRDKWKHTTAERLLFSHRLDEREWSPFLEGREVSFTDLPIGKHYFQVRAMDRNGNIDPKPARLEFAIVAPWYRETRLVWILTIALAVAIFFAALAFNRHRRLQYSYAEVERQVAERTRELELANRELVHSQKMNALGTLAAGIAHDFNNILSIVKGSAQIIEENLDNAAKVRTRLDRIKTVVQQGAGIVEAMLGFTRASVENVGPCDVNSVVDDTLTLLGDRFLREVEVQFRHGEHLPKVSAARDFVQQVLLNFIFNAAEAMERRSPNRLESGEINRPRTGTESGRSSRKLITLTTRLVVSPPPGTVLLPREARSYVAISVNDCGCGILPENLPRIFEPFFTTKAMSARRGTGLGLSMVYELAKKLEAGLSVETVVGQGSTFTIVLPAMEERADTKPETEISHASRSVS